MKLLYTAVSPTPFPCEPVNRSQRAECVRPAATGKKQANQPPETFIIAPVTPANHLAEPARQAFPMWLPTQTERSQTQRG